VVLVSYWVYRKVRVGRIRGFVGGFRGGKGEVKG